jgi:oligopeptide/dipeptide ABC transporter ATP-binding protein
VKTSEPLIEVKNLKTYFHTESGIGRAVDGVSFSISPEKTLGVVGESGCGKSVTARSILALIETPGRIENGEILFRQNGEVVDLAKLDPKGRAMRDIRGNDIAMIFQEPMTSLNPVFTIGDQIIEGILLHRGIGRSNARRLAIEMLESVAIPSPEQRVDDYPHQLSGGMRQRAMIAMALSCNPALLIADEPTTALDVTIQAQVIELMRRLQKDFKAAIMFITHDLGVIANIADDVIVMYLGEVVESGTVREIFHNTKHPYTQGLMNSLPVLTHDRGRRLVAIEGNVPSPFAVPDGCRFAPRCPHVMEVCRQRAPRLHDIGNGHRAACHLNETAASEAPV